MRIDEFISLVEKIAPLNSQESWDNSGFQLKLANGEISKVLLALEINEQVIDEAIESKSDLILTHHPLIFGELKGVDCNTITGNNMIKLIQHGISVYSSHTPFDKCAGGNNDYLGMLLNLKNVRPMAGDESGFCRMGTLTEPLTAGEFVDYAAKTLRMDKRYFNFAGTSGDIVKEIGWCSGSGAEFLDLAVEAGCDLYFTGDVKYHTAQHAKDLGMNLLDCGHFGTEYIFCENMYDRLDKILSWDIMQKPEIIISKVNLNPFILV